MVDTSSFPTLVVKNVDISSYPKINAWMFRMGKEEGTDTTIALLV
jgi:hypothetical protein